MADGTAVIAGEVHNGTDVYHIRLRGKLAFIEAAAFLFICVKLRLDAKLISLHIDITVLVPVFRGYVFFGIDLAVIHKCDHIALFGVVATCLFARAGVGDEIKPEKIECCALADRESAYDAVRVSPKILGKHR